MRLIDADKMQTELLMINERSNIFAAPFAGRIKRFIDRQPTIEERKHGHWFAPEDDDGRTAWHCSVCDYVVKTIGFYPNYNYCPCCGARMDEEVRK